MAIEAPPMASESIAPPLKMGKMVRQSFHAMTPHEKIRVIAMYGSILALHALGILIFIVFVVPVPLQGPRHSG
jgi:hypothetical protein